MTVHCFGSINVDHVHRVAHFPAPGETLSDLGYDVGLGGKGANQGVAAARAGAATRFIGAVGADGGWTREKLAAAGVDVSAVSTLDAATGHAVIYVDPAGENSIVIHGGANQAITRDIIEAALDAAKPGDWWLTQNETNLVAESLAMAKERGLQTAYSAAPFDAQAAEAVLPHLDLLAVNEGEAKALRAHLGHDPDVPLMVTTLGATGVMMKHRDDSEGTMATAFKVSPVDTTGAGDTFIGSLVAAMDQGKPLNEAAKYAQAAAALSVTRPGAAEAIPTATEVFAFLEERL